MVDYVAAPHRPRSVEAGDDWWPEPRETIDVVITSEVLSINTGLVDQYGMTIWRYPRQYKLGF